MECILVSSCLCGNNVKYNGLNNYFKEIEKLKDKYKIIPICPEVLGDLSIPRAPSEILNGKVINSLGIDVTKNFCDGAKKTLEIALKNNCTKAILKEKSPSCGVYYIYDGTFCNKLIEGKGITSKLLTLNGIKVYNEFEIDKINP